MSFVDNDNWAPGKRRFYDRIVEEKRGKEYRSFRDSLKTSPGIPPNEAWRVAGSQYPPLGGGPMEYPPTEDTLGWIKRMGIKNPWSEDISIAVEVGEDLIEGTKLEDEKYETASKKILKSAASMEALAEMVGQERSATELECARWAFDNMLVPWDKVDPDGVPSIGAIGLLEFAKKNSVEFLRNIWVKLLPDRKALDQQSRFTDDGTEQLADLDAFDKEFAEREASDAA